MTPCNSSRVDLLGRADFAKPPPRQSAAHLNHSRSPSSNAASHDHEYRSIVTVSFESSPSSEVYTLWVIDYNTVPKVLFILEAGEMESSGVFVFINLPMLSDCPLKALLNQKYICFG